MPSPPCFERHRTGHDPKVTIVIIPTGGRHLARGHLTERVAEPIEAHPGRARIIDAGRERPDHELDQLLDEELDILRRCPRGSDDEGTPERLAERIVNGRARPDHDQRCPVMDEAPRLSADPQHDIVFGRQRQQCGTVIRLDVAAGVGARGVRNVGRSRLAECLCPRRGALVHGQAVPGTDGTTAPSKPPPQWR